MNLMSLLTGIAGVARAGFSLAGTVAGGPLAWLSGIWGLISSLWATEFGRLLIVGASAFVIAWCWGWEHEHAAKERAMAARDAQWQQQIADANKASEDRIQAALAAAQAVLPAPGSKTGLLDLCKAEAACRKALRNP